MAGEYEMSFDLKLLLNPNSKLMAGILWAYTVLAYIVMASSFCSTLTQSSWQIVMANLVMAYVVMAASFCLTLKAHDRLLIRH